MALTLPDLPYPHEALEPHIDAETMRIHHGKHHQAYVDKGNAALEGTELEGLDAKEILTSLDKAPADRKGAIRNNVGGAFNHSLFWRIMGPDGGGEPDGALRAAIDAAFGDFDAFTAQFEAAGAGQFGSGWAWLVHDGSGLAIQATANQDSPISDGKTPLMGVDVWEHAYYLNYQNRRPDYLAAWWNVVNWSAVAEEFANAA